MKPQTKKAFRALWACASVLVGNGLLALSVEAFIVPHDIIMGGTTGIGIVMANLFPVDMATVVLLLNGALLLLGWLVLGWKLVASTVASSLLYPVLLVVVRSIPGIDSLTDNALMAALFGGVLMGAALGIVMRVGSSTGGMDIAGLVLHKWTHIPLSICVYLWDAIIIGGQALFAGAAEPVLYGMVVLVLQSIVLDKVMILGQAQIQLLVITQQYEALRRALLTKLQAGVTLFQIETGALQEQQKSVMCVIPHRKLFAAKELIQAIDPAAFITITQVKEVRGRGFTLERLSRLPQEQQEK